MNDAERDAWLREALRHAPDSGALPPHELSEAILASARAAARSPQGLPLGRASRPTPIHRIAAFWHRLARPPVAAGFASVLAATLVGLMWWDRPMDEMLARRAPAAHEEAAPAVADAVVRPAQAPMPASGAALADSLAPRWQQRSMAAEQSVMPNAKVAPSKSATEAASPSGEGTREAPRQQSEAKQEAPAAFSRDELQRAAPVVPTPPGALKKDAERSEPDAGREPASRNGAVSAADARATTPTARSDAPAPAAAPVAKSIARAPAPVAPATPAPAAPPAEQTPPLASGRLDQDEQRAAAASHSEPEKAKLAAAQPALRKRSADEARGKEASAFASSNAAAERNAAAGARREGVAGATPLAPVLASIGADPAQWSRQSASGAVVALDSGWRDWLLQLDTAAAGRWRALAASNATPRGGESARAATPTLRLVARDRSVVIGRLEGSTVILEGAAGERWQANLPPEAAERLRASAERLAP